MYPASDRVGKLATLSVDNGSETLRGELIAAFVCLFTTDTVRTAASFVIPLLVMQLQQWKQKNVTERERERERSLKNEMSHLSNRPLKFNGSCVQKEISLSRTFYRDTPGCVCVKWGKLTPELYVSIFLVLWQFQCRLKAAGLSVRNEKLALLWSEAVTLGFLALLTRSRMLWFLSELINQIPLSFQTSPRNAAHPSFWFLLCRELPTTAENRDNESAETDVRESDLGARCTWERWACAPASTRRLSATGSSCGAEYTESIWAWKETNEKRK